MSERQQLEQQARVVLEWQKRQQDDPLARFQPTVKQQPFIDHVLGGGRRTFFYAANRSGKSVAGAYCGAHLARFGKTPTRAAYSSGGAIEVHDRATSGLVVSLTASASQNVLQPKYFDNGFAVGAKPFIPAREIMAGGWRISDGTLRLKNGSIVEYKSCAEGERNMMGYDRDWIHLDEEPPYPVFEEVSFRVGAGRSLQIFLTATLLPSEGGGGVSWGYTKIIQPYLAGILPGVEVFGSSIYDNPHIRAEEIHELEAIAPLDSPIGRIRLGGEWLPGLSGSRAYTAFNRQVHLRPQAEPNWRMPLCWFWDFNVEPMISGVGQRDGRVYRVFRLLKLDEGNVGAMVEWFRECYPRHGAEVWIYGDATGRGRDAGHGQSDYQIILNAMRTYPAPVRVKVPEKNPNVTDRINAVNMALRDEHGEVRVEIDPAQCQELTLDLEGVLRGPDGKIKKTKNRSDPYFWRTHASDAFGYWIARESPVRGWAAPMPEGVRAVPMPTYAWSGR